MHSAKFVLIVMIFIDYCFIISVIGLLLLLLFSGVPFLKNALCKLLCLGVLF